MYTLKISSFLETRDSPSSGNPVPATNASKPVTDGDSSPGLRLSGDYPSCVVDSFLTSLLKFTSRRRPASGKVLPTMLDGITSLEEERVSFVRGKRSLSRKRD